jgi:hypothetical protein
MRLILDLHSRTRGQSKADLDRLAAGAKAFVDKSATDSAARRASATQKLEATYANLTAAEVSKRWWTEADTTIEDWGRTTPRAARSIQRP